MKRQVQSLGMLRINSSIPAEKTFEMILKKLKNFSLYHDQDILGLVTNGVSVMKKLGKLLNIVHQLCHSHGIHLAVVNVFYKKKNI